MWVSFVSPAHKIFGQQESAKWTRDERHCAGLAEKLGRDLFQQRHTKASPTIRKVPEFTAWLCRYQQVAKKIFLLKFSEHFLPLISSCSWTCYIQIILVPTYLNYTSNKFYFILLLLEVNSDQRAWRYGIQWILYIIHHTAKTNAHSILLILP